MAVSILNAVNCHHCCEIRNGEMAFVAILANRRENAYRRIRRNLRDTLNPFAISEDA